MSLSASVKSQIALLISFLRILEVLRWHSRVPEDTGGASAMVEKENATGFTMPSKIQQYRFEIARLKWSYYNWQLRHRVLCCWVNSTSSKTNTIEMVSNGVMYGRKNNTAHQLELPERTRTTWYLPPRLPTLNPHSMVPAIPITSWSAVVVPFFLFIGTAIVPVNMSRPTIHCDLLKYVSSQMIFEASINAEINSRCPEDPLAMGKWDFRH